MDLKELCPKMNDSGAVVEPFESYCARVQPLLPNFPRDALEQWFHNHPAAIEEWAWLDYRSCKFVEAFIAGADINNLDFSGTLVETLIGTDANLYNRVCGDPPRMRRIKDYFREHGTWPRPVIFLCSLGPNDNQPEGFAFRKPLHLVEGHWRVAAYFLLKNGTELKDAHRIWKVEA